MQMGFYVIVLVFIVMCCSLTAGTQVLKEGFQSIKQQKQPYSVSVEEDGTTTPEVKYIKLKNTEKDGYGIKEVLYHNASCFTQGLIYDSKLRRFYESCGQYQQSLVQMYSLAEKKVYSRVHLPKNVFGEGIAIFDGKLTVLTWKEKTSFVYGIDDKKFAFEKQLPFRTSNGEGWGATMGYLPNSETPVFYVSDGSCNVMAFNPSTLEEMERKCIVDKSSPPASGKPVRYINELQYVNGKIFANVWMSNKVAIIDWDQGCITKWIDFQYLTSLVSLPSNPNARHNAVLNGLTWDEEQNDLFVTGKLWNRMFRIHLF